MTKVADKTLKYAIIGTGMMGHEHLRNLALVPDKAGISLEVVALIDPDQPMLQLAEALAQQLGFTQLSSYHRLDDVSMDGIDAFVIVSPNFTHHDIISRLLPTCKAVLAEKQVCTTVEHCNDLSRRLADYPAPFWVAME